MTMASSSAAAPEPDRDVLLEAFEEPAPASTALFTVPDLFFQGAPMHHLLARGCGAPVAAAKLPDQI